MFLRQHFVMSGLTRLLCKPVIITSNSFSFRLSIIHFRTATDV